MDINEARQVLWLNNYPRPLGELFDEGYLTRGRLTWAAEKAHDPRLREAAKAFLGLFPPGVHLQESKGRESDRPGARAFDLGITLEQARAKPWPFGPLKNQPMGELVDSKQLSLKDLAFAVETAWDDSIRKSAMALLLERLEQILKEPPPSTGLVQVISGGRSHAEREQSWLTFLQGGIVGLIIALCIFLIVWTFRSLGTSHASALQLADLVSTPSRVIALAVFVVLTGVVFWIVLGVPELLDRRLQKQIDAYRVGQEGEDRAVEVILQAIDGNWSVFRNVVLPGRNRGDLDLILVGPPGIWALEVKNLHGEFRNIGDTWEYRDGKTWKMASAQPSQQARTNAGRLAGFLKADGLNVFANPAVVWANPESPLTVENPMVAVWPLERLPDELGNIWHSKQMPAATREKIVEKLTRLCERQRSDGQGRH